MMRKLIILGFLFSLLFFPFSQVPATEVEKDQSFSLCTARAAVQTTVLRGYTRARWRRFLTCEETGRCLEVRAEMGDVIGPDGLFARIDTTFIDLELEANQAAAARLENQMVYWHREVKRYRKLSGQKAVSETRVQELELKYDQARLTLAELEVKTALLKERRRRCQIKAPTGWHLLVRKVEPGEWLTMGRIVGQVGDYRTLLVPFSLTMAQYEWLKRERERLSLVLPAVVSGQPSLAVPARWLHLSPAFDQKTRKIQVELEISEGLPEMRGGITLELSIDLPEAGGVVEVPVTAVIERYGAFWLVRENGEEVKVVKLGQTVNGDFRVVGENVKSGDRFSCR
ncbi:MAG: efflux RND transporter periplasmic adaptor subunit [Deltaproteobacteria bacterium]|nr:efflux RND transporter periplasmic adaptor subunit [Deltaproteobacteria bacterium]